MEVLKMESILKCTDTQVEDNKGLRDIKNVDMFNIAKESSSIKQVGYDKENGNLYIKFNKRSYVFFDVPLSIFHKFLEDSSVEFSPGSFFHERIKGSFEYRSIS